MEIVGDRLEGSGDYDGVPTERGFRGGSGEQLSPFDAAEGVSVSWWGMIDCTVGVGCYSRQMGNNKIVGAAKDV